MHIPVGSCMTQNISEDEVESNSNIFFIATINIGTFKWNLTSIIFDFIAFKFDLLDFHNFFTCKLSKNWFQQFRFSIFKEMHFLVDRVFWFEILSFESSAKHKTFELHLKLLKNVAYKINETGWPRK